MDISIKPMTLTDYDEAIALWKSSEGIGLNESDTRPAIALFLERNPGLSLVARDGGGRLVGAVITGHDGRRGYLYHLAVAASHRRRGIGLRLVNECLVALKKLGIPRCNIFVYADNEEGKKFWKLHNWQERPQMRMMHVRTDGGPVD